MRTAQIERLTVEGVKREGKSEWGVALPTSRLEGATCRNSVPAGSGAEIQSQTVLVHVRPKCRRTPVVEGKLLKIIEKSCKKNWLIFLTGGSYAPYAPSPCLATPLVTGAR